MVLRYIFYPFCYAEMVGRLGRRSGIDTKDLYTENGFCGKMSYNVQIKF